MARGLGDAMIQSPVKTGARILNEFSRMGLPGVATVQDIFAGGSRGLMRSSIPCLMAKTRLLILSVKV